MSESDHVALPPMLASRDLRKEWWDHLPSTWKEAFITGFLNRLPGSLTEDHDLQEIAMSPVLRFVGPKGLHPNIVGPLDSAKHLEPLTNLEYLFLTFCELESLEGIQSMRNLKSLFIHNNKISSLEPAGKLVTLQELYCNDNQITSLFPLQHCHQLKALHCQYNALSNLRGITRSHSRVMKQFVCLPNDGVSAQEVRRTERKTGIECVKE